MSYYFHLSLLLGSLFFSLSCGVYKYKKTDIPSRILCLLLAITFLDEGIAYAFAKIYHNNLPVYSIFNIIQFVLVAGYFNYVIDVFRKNNLGIYAGIVGALTGILNIIFLQPLNTFNSNFLFFEGLCIISMALFFFFRLLLVNDNLQLHSYPHFWFAVILTLFWSSTFLLWGLYEFYVEQGNKRRGIRLALLAVNVTTYIAIGINFLFYHKMKGVNGR